MDGWAVGVYSCCYFSNNASSMQAIYTSPPTMTYTPYSLLSCCLLEAYIASSHEIREERNRTDRSMAYDEALAFLHQQTRRGACMMGTSETSFNPWFLESKICKM